MTDVDNFCPSSKEEWRDWLEVNHAKKDALWLIFYKVKSPKHNLTWSEAVDEALCFGWIDSVKKPIDAETFKQYFSKRKPSSTWSKINKDKVESLTAQNRMQAAGNHVIQVAKTNGSWSMLDDVEALILPSDLELALRAEAGAMEYYQGLSKSGKKLLLSWVIMAKRTETRQKRIAAVAESAGRGVRPEKLT